MRASQFTTAASDRTQPTEGSPAAGTAPAGGVDKTALTEGAAGTAPAGGADKTALTEGAEPSPLILDRYRLKRRLGTGGFGTVWMARDERLERDVAVKMLPRECVTGGRFEREARAAARLSHPGIVTLFEAVADDEGAYLVSELVRGSTLARALEAGRLSDRAILRIGIALCEAIAHAHANGVVHRDVKPSNVLLPSRPASPPQAAKLTDFGIARVVGGDTLTRTGELVGTTAYMAPEQAEGRDVGEPADLYSLALVLYEALTGINPVPQVMRATDAHRSRRLGMYLPPLRRQRRELPRELGQSIDLALRPRPRERGTIEELRAGLEAVLDRVEDEPGIVAPPPGLGARTATLRRPRPSLGGRAPRAAASAGGLGDNSTGSREISQGPRGGEGRAAVETLEHPVAAQPPSGTPQRPWPTRALAATATAVLAAWLTSQLLHPAPLPPPVVALLAGLAVIALPRLAWLALTAALAVTLVLQHHPGAALIVTTAALLPAAAMPLTGGSWSLAVVAPALGLLFPGGLAGAWPALAARARGPWRRAALGALGWTWLLVASALLGRNLYARLPAGMPAPSVWRSSPYEATHHVLAPVLSSGVLAGAAVWALAAVLLPLLPRTRSLLAHTLTAAVWALATAWSTVTALRAAGAVRTAPGMEALILATLVAVIAAVLPRATRRIRTHLGRPR